MEPIEPSIQSLDDLKYHVYARGSLTGSEYHRRLNDIKDDSLEVDTTDEPMDRLVLTSSGTFHLFKANESKHLERNFTQKVYEKWYEKVYEKGYEKVYEKVYDEWLEEAEMAETIEKEGAEEYGPNLVEKVTYYTTSTGKEFKNRTRRIRKEGVISKDANEGGSNEDDASCEKPRSCESGQKVMIVRNEF